MVVFKQGSLRLKVSAEITVGADSHRLGLEQKTGGLSVISRGISLIILDFNS